MKVEINYLGKRGFKARIGKHEIVTDLPEEKGGSDRGPTPSELFVASLGSCAALFAVRYLETAKLNPEKLRLEMDWDFDENKTRIGRIDMAIFTPLVELGDRKKALVNAARKCVVHNTLEAPPEIRVEWKELILRL